VWEREGEGEHPGTPETIAVLPLRNCHEISPLFFSKKKGIRCRML
jgi:hypothetical protein